MKLLFFTEARLNQTADKNFYSADQSFSFQMFKRYLEAFDNVLVVARAAKVENGALDENTRVNNNAVTVLPLPYYVGPYQYILKRNKFLRTLRHYIDLNSDAAIICRVPGTVGTAAARYLFKKKRPYGVEVVGDPRDVFAAGSFNHPLRRVFRYSGIKNLKTVVKNTSAAIYVSKQTLQARYPVRRKTFSTNASNVILPPEAFVMEAKVLKKSPPFSIVTVGTLAVMYKAPDITIKAMSILKTRGLRVSLQWMGDGKYRPAMEALAKRYGVFQTISFTGHIRSACAVRKNMDGGDLFVLPSRTEGLPRALLEAMARGLPCIGTEIGGIPELLDKMALVPVNDPKRLAERIEHFLNTPKLADAQAKRNLIEAKNYASEILDTRRLQFYEYLRGIS